MIVIIMGVSGCGKSTIAAEIAKQLNIEYLDADDLHPPENKQLMSSGVALTDENRMPWLGVVRDYAANCHTKKQSCIIACSALKKKYRNVLNEASPMYYVFLDGQKSLIQRRILERAGHFMPESLLNSQFEALEPPGEEPNVITVSIDANPEEIANSTIIELKKLNII